MPETESLVIELKRRKMQNISDFIRNHWHVYVALVALCGLLGSGVGYYARAEAEKLVDKKLEFKFDKLQKNYNDQNKELNKLQNEVTKNSERLKGIDEKTDIILQFLQRGNQ